MKSSSRVALFAADGSLCDASSFKVASQVVELQGEFDLLLHVVHVSDFKVCVRKILVISGRLGNELNQVVEALLWYALLNGQVSQGFDGVEVVFVEVTLRREV